MVGNVNSKLRQARELLHQLDIAQDLRLLSDQEAWLRRRLKQYCLALASLQRTIARVRSSICWLQDGDANTAYFHLHARYRKRKNFIAKLQVDGNMVFSQEEEQAVWDFYNGLLGTHAPRATAIELSALDLPSHDCPLSTCRSLRRRCGQPLRRCRPTRRKGRMVSLAVSTRSVGR